MADVTPFRAVRYTGAAGPLPDLVAPPYDVVDDAQRAALYTRSPYNVVHVTLPESPEAAARIYEEWFAEGILEHEDGDSVWLAVEDYVGPDGVARQRHGVIGSIVAVPYGTGDVLPHERTHRSILEERLALLRLTHLQPEPILVLAEAPLDLAVPDRAPDLVVEGTRLWRARSAGPLPAGQLLIADGHHRYESAVELGEERGDPVRIMALVVSTDDPGLHVFPTHRVFAARPDLEADPDGEECADAASALERLAAEPHDRSAVVAYRRDRVELVRGDVGELDADLIDRYGLEGIGYTQHADDAMAAVDRRDVNVAFLMRHPRIEDVFAAARNGVRMPPKSTYFHPKPVAGLVFHPVLS